MSKVYQLPSGKDPGSEAADWIAKLDRGLSEEEEAQLRQWLSASPDHRNQFLAMAQFWDKMNSLAWLSDLVAKPEPRTRYSWGIAASALLAAGVAALVLLLSFDAQREQQAASGIAAAPGPSPTIYETAIGEQSTVRLSEGTEIVLNTDSQLHVRMTKHHRVLSLVRGEVHVEVAPDPSRPLSVVVGDKVFQAVGTAFGLALDAELNIELVVTEGSVLVGSRPRSAPGAEQVNAPILPPSSTTVNAGQELRVTPLGLEKLTVPPEEIEARLSWRQGNLIFRGESLEEALREVSKYTTIEFVFLNDSIRQEPIAGRYKAGDVETLLAALRENVGLAYERTDDDRVLLSQQQ